MAYTVIARRYRSQTFDDVVGQDAVAQTLKNAIQIGRVAHAYLFCGTRGVGKTTMARILAKSLNCLNSVEPTVTPCLKCDSCVSVNTGDDIDVVEIDGASNRGIDNIRELIQNAIYRPARARFKIYIIDEVHMLTKEAFNALLKILEEPPEHVKFIFATTEPNKVLATIQSRCQRFDFQNISAKIIGAQLEMILKEEKITFESNLIVHLSRLANGSMRDALSLLDQLISAGAEPLTEQQLNDLVGVPDRQKVMNLLAAIAAHDAAGVLEAIEQLIDSGQTSGQICDLLIQNMRDIMVLQSAGSDSHVLVLTDEEKQQLESTAQSFDIPGVIYNITALEKLRWTLRTSETSRALLEASLLRLTLSEHFIGLRQLSTQLTASTSAGLSVKKKIAPIKASASAGLPRAQSVQKQTPLSVGKEIASVQASWQAIVDMCAQNDSSLKAFLAQAHPAYFENSTLTLCFSSDGTGQLAKNMCQRKSSLLQEALSKILSMNISICFETTDEKKTSDKQTKSEPAPDSETSGLDRHQRQQALNDPMVQMILKGFDAKPVEIQKIPIQSDVDQEEMLVDQETD